MFIFKNMQIEDHKITKLIKEMIWIVENPDTVDDELVEFCKDNLEDLGIEWEIIE